MNFNDFQDKCTYHRTTHTPEPLVYSMMGLVEEVGEIASIFKRGSRLGFSMQAVAAIKQEQILDEAGDVLWYLARLLRECGLSLGDAAEGNVSKLGERRKAGV
jgi:NTP pyrophosphatase (non-canonical NTP hydrolase)